MRILSGLIGLLLLSQPAFAQDDWDDDELELEPDKVEPAYDGPPPEGTDEDPTDPKTVRAKEEQRAREEKQKVDLPLPVPDEYPQNFIARPLILPDQMIEVGLEVPSTINPGGATFVIGAKYSITPRVQIGLGYGIGTYYSGGFEVGKTIEPGVRVLIFDWLSAEMKLPLFMDPFATGIILGAPMQFNLGKWQIAPGANLIGITLKDFVPAVSSPATNIALAEAAQVNTALPAGFYNLGALVTYQQNEASAFFGELYLNAPDFSVEQANYSMFFGYRHAFSNKFDVLLRAGSPNLENIDESITITAAMLLRI